VFVRNLVLAQGELPSSVLVNLVDANNQTFDVPAESLRQMSNTDLVQLVFALPNNLAAGTCDLKIKAHGQASNTGTIRIRS